ncbi:heavy metal response regulator transcription factor [Undibacterium sp. CY18W]|uniref:Heavy metal response regulator transcription factor n=1 Tax=Undibacterium hunanense TaxID=2762292 RepID=A0ABR6ZKT9_9BURK|nr:heavy metal response regulator transcription factor [Undibacterium hunanense]MBC3916520.1 heavy metal response regulator transcription factor [Undibacterium hunanense]
MTLLVIEDDQKTGEYLKKGFQESGYTVDLARNGIDGLHLALEGEHELIILDVMMPGMDGWTLISALRAKRDVPVIFLTAKDRLEDKIKGLQLGADDYLVKPFSFAELLLRVRTILRRGVAKDARDADIFQIGDLQFDAIKHKVTRQGVQIVLTKKEFMLLHLLIKRQGEALSRSVIASQVWDMNFDSDTNVVDVAVKRLRAKLDAPFEQKLIHTVRSVGYMFSDQP